MENYLTQIKSLIAPEFLQSASLEIRKSKTQVKSLVVSSPATPYRESVNNLVFAKIKTEGKQPYISFRSTYTHDLTALGLQPYQTKSDADFCRVALASFFESGVLHNSALADLLNRIFADTMNFPAFGCCSRYNECSDAKKCLHPDQMYATACAYRKNLENGNIFYGVNKTI